MTVGFELLRSGTNAVRLASARGDLAAHERVFRSLERHALVCRERGEDLAAAAWAQVAFQYGWAAPCGVLAAPALESLLNDLGRAHASAIGERAPAGDPASVLHVMTECYATGGHTRSAQHWIERDSRRSTVVLTGQLEPLPEGLLAALDERGASLVPSLGGGDLFARARALRALACEHDLVVLHVHMHDVLPALAFADPAGRPPTVFFEHAAHQLWVGSGASDVVGCFRDTEMRLAVSRRGIDPDRIRLLPLPLSERALPEREDARRQLGLEPDIPVLLTIASDWKVRPVLEPGFSEMAADILEALPEAVLLVVGPKPGPQWLEAERRSGGRVRVLGPVPDPSAQLAAADALLDSWPASGGVVVLEAAAAGLPILSLSVDDPDLTMVRAYDPAVDLGIVRASTVEELAVRARELLADADRRARVGRELREAVDRDHGSGWGERLEDVVGAACELAGTARPPAVIGAVPASDWECILGLLLSEEHRMSPHGALLARLGDLPAHARPNDADELVATVNLVLEAGAERRRRAVAAPVLEHAAVSTLVDELRRLSAAGEITECIVAIPPERLDEGVALLQDALDQGTDLEIDVVPASSLDGVAQATDLVV